MGRFQDAPDHFWHCMIGTAGASTARMLRDMTKDELLEKILRPWSEQRPFVVSGSVFRNHDEIKTVRIVRTEYPSSTYTERAKARGDIGFPYAHIHEGEDFATELLSEVLTTGAGRSADIPLLLQLCQRLPHAAKPLALRRKGRPVLAISDEYDAQDLLHTIVRAYFKYAVSEEPIKKLGNGKSTRADFVIEHLGAIVELKYAHGPDDQGRIVDDLAIDLAYYEQWEPLKALIYVVYNSGALDDPEALDRLTKPRSSGGKKYDVFVVRA